MIKALSKGRLIRKSQDGIFRQYEGALYLDSQGTEHPLSVLVEAETVVDAYYTEGLDRYALDYDRLVIVKSDAKHNKLVLSYPENSEWEVTAVKARSFEASRVNECIFAKSDKDAINRVQMRLARGDVQRKKELQSYYVDWKATKIKSRLIPQKFEGDWSSFFAPEEFDPNHYEDDPKDWE